MRSNIFRKLRRSVATLLVAAVAGSALVGLAGPSAAQQSMAGSEKIWAALKEKVAANRSFANLFVLGQFIRAFFDTLTPARALSLAGLRNDFCEAT